MRPLCCECVFTLLSATFAYLRVDSCLRKASEVLIVAEAHLSEVRSTPRLHPSQQALNLLLLCMQGLEVTFNSHKVGNTQQFRRSWFDPAGQASTDLVEVQSRQAFFSSSVRRNSSRQHSAAASKLHSDASAQQVGHSQSGKLV